MFVLEKLISRIGNYLFSFKFPSAKEFFIFLTDESTLTVTVWFNANKKYVVWIRGYVTRLPRAKP